MKSYGSTALIGAAADTVWGVLIDAARWPAWDSGVTQVDGVIALGARLKVTVAASPGRAFPVKVTDLQPGRSMTWSGGMPLGLFRGVRTYRLEPSGPGTEFRVREEYTGAALPLIWRSMPDLQPSFDQFARGLKRQAEQIAAGRA
jgi:hypothetical protein